MQFEFDIGRACGVQESPANDGSPIIVRVEETALQHQQWGEGLRAVLDAVGERSRRAQGLGKAVTSGRSAHLGGNNVYLLVAENVVLGLLKTGPKKLFVAKGLESGLVEINAQCVLDFYIVEGKQRAGFGRFLFEEMLGRERMMPDKLAYDRPSPKLLSFLQKYYGLSRYVPQNNNFVVFDAYFSGQHRATPGPRAQESRPKPTVEPQFVKPTAGGRMNARDEEATQRIPKLTAGNLARSRESDDHRDETVAAGMPSGGKFRSAGYGGPAAALGGCRRSSSGNCSDSPAQHPHRSAHRHAQLST